MVAPGAAAHLRFPKFEAERAVSLQLEGPIRITYRVGFGPDRATDLRRRADTDRDGEVSSAEANLAFDARTSDLLKALQVCTGRDLASVSCESLPAEAVREVEATGWKPKPPGHLHFEWVLDLGVTTEEVGAVRIEDHYEVDGVGVTAVDVAAPEALGLLSAGADGRDELQREFVWLEAKRQPGPRVVHAVWPPPSRPRWVLLLLVGLLLGGAGGVWWNRRRLAG